MDRSRRERGVKNVLGLILAGGSGYNVKSATERFHMSEGGVTVIPKGADI